MERERMKSAMLFGPKSQGPNVAGLMMSLAELSFRRWGMYDFEPFVSVARSVELALAKQPEGLFVTIELGGPPEQDWTALMRTLKEKGYIGPMVLWRDFSENTEAAAALLRAAAANPRAWTDPDIAERYRSRLAWPSWMLGLV